MKSSAPFLALAALIAVCGGGSTFFAGALMTKAGSLVADRSALQTHRQCSLRQHLAPEAAHGSLLEITFDACNSVRVKDLSLLKTRSRSALHPRQSSFADPCANFADGCAWTSHFNCPGQSPPGSGGEAKDDGNLGYQCCCGASLWKGAWNATAPGVLAATAEASIAEGERADSDADVASADAASENGTRQVVWVSGYPRSGSSTMLSMVSAASGHLDAREPGQTFSLFEPCHNGDELSPVLEVTGCMGLLGSIANCEFAGVQHLWGWPDPHSTNNKTAFSSEAATRICKESNLIAFKTVDFAHDLKRYMGMVDAEPRLKILDVVRDPRGIWGSWKTLEPFSTLVKEGSFYSLLEICETFASNLELNHSNIHHVVFEELVSDPVKTTMKVYDFLDIPFEEPQRAWVDRTFDAKECPPPPPGVPKEFTDCHEKSKNTAEKWREVLSDEELASFNASPACQKVVRAYGFPAA